MSKLVIQKATVNDIPQIEEMYKKRVLFNDAHGTHQWYLHEVTWEEFAKLYTIDQYFVGKVDGVVACGMFLVDVDELYWPQEKAGNALYLHKICVHPDYSKKGYSDALIQFFKQYTFEMGYPVAKLDVREHKIKLRAMYERNGFKYLRSGKFVEEFDTALYYYDGK